ncbi:hypothetical protein M758_6G019500 [Ceratodon purpureus]|nr:hypothetical protein M758_6G019500 [Ceratodon purpureus]
MKASKRILDTYAGVLSMNTALVLIVINCLFLVFQISSNAPSIYERGWWPPRPQLMGCVNATTTTMDEPLNMSSIDLSRGDVRFFHPHGIASRLIVEVGSYRNGPRTFSSVVMTSKHLNNLHEILYECEWVSSDDPPLKVKARAIKPDWNMGRLYGTMVLVCEFPRDVGTDAEGGRLVLTAGYAEPVFRSPERFVALTEMRGEYNASRYAPPYPYEITFCGSPLYGNISPQRVREWIAYHAWFFGEKTLFIFQDAGGIHEEVYRVLKPWIDIGRVRVQNLRQAEVYDGYYHHQFTMLNDCMLMSQTLANWTFFFDVDEFLYIPPSGEPYQPTIGSILAEKARNNVTQILFQNVKVSDGLCWKSTRRVLDEPKISRKWAFEKLVYANCDYGWKPDESRKYAVQPQRVWATGVHRSEHMKLDGKQEDMEITTLRAYHYHNTANGRTELCREFPLSPNGEPNSLNVRNCTLDFSMATLAPTIKSYELAMVGKQPFIL